MGVGGDRLPSLTRRPRRGGRRSSSVLQAVEQTLILRRLGALQQEDVAALYVSSWEDQGMLSGGVPVEYKEGGRGLGGGNLSPFVPTPGAPTKGIPGAPVVPNLRRGPINNWTDAAGHDAVLAIDPGTGEPKGRFLMTDVTDTGIVTTASDLLLTGGREGYVQALDARTETLLWKANLGAQMLNNPITYAVNGRQYIAAMAGLTLFTFALPN